MLVDSHCHIDFAAFDEDRREVLERAKAAGVEKILNPAIDLSSSRAICELAGQNEMVYAAVGVHPNDTHDWQAGWIAELRDLAGHPKVVALGEIGLDFYRDWSPPQQQLSALEAQLALAEELNLPVILHNRQAGQELISVLESWCAGLRQKDAALAQAPGVLHSFSEDFNFAQRAIAMNFYIGIAGPVTFKNAKTLQELAAQLPSDTILVETDAPFLTPHPHRGKRNEPGQVRLVAEKIAALRSESFTKIANITTANSKRLFHW